MLNMLDFLFILIKLAISESNSKKPVSGSFLKEKFFFDNEKFFFDKKKFFFERKVLF